MDPNKPVVCVGIPELDSVANFHRALHLPQQVQVVAINRVVPLLSELQLERVTSDRASKALVAAKPHSDGGRAPRPPLPHTPAASSACSQREVSPSAPLYPPLVLHGKPGDE